MLCGCSSPCLSGCCAPVLRCGLAAAGFCLGARVGGACCCGVAAVAVAGCRAVAAVCLLSANAACTFLAAGSLEGWILSCSAVRSCVWLLSTPSALACAVGVSEPWSMGRVSHHGLWRTAWLGDGSGWGRCHAHSAHVIASLGNLGNVVCQVIGGAAAAVVLRRLGSWSLPGLAHALVPLFPPRVLRCWWRVVCLLRLARLSGPAGVALALPLLRLVGLAVAIPSSSGHATTGSNRRSSRNSIVGLATGSPRLAHWATLPPVMSSLLCSMAVTLWCGSVARSTRRAYWRLTMVAKV